MSSVDAAQSSNDAVTRRFLLELRIGAPLALRGDGQGAVFGEATVIDKIVKILARRAISPLMAALDRSFAVCVTASRIPIPQLDKLWAKPRVLAAYSAVAHVQPPVELDAWRPRSMG
ncbi:MAG: hypothetical protein Cons2KO_25320 [Congregibacter sp.]